ncbi:betaine homocysteine S-methyltransferase 1 [Apostichopus japonicus]|uniref:Betaine homocysteine S-methyltransferase 1 n=1 Tax=Stichopus japonicus TaxID=307972 RepID=A0A2G8K030_STIJA|nr:betaine homocysteine S-methyltransferase 1 [Apostichopus japonicus]
MALIGREADLEKMNRDALRIAKEVSEKTNTLLAGQIELAVDEGVDFVIAETFVLFEEAMIALEAIKEFGKGVPSVVTMAAHLHDGENGKNLTVDNVEICEAMKKLEAAGADVVGLNCANGPETILGYMELIRQSGVKVCCSMYRLNGNVIIVRAQTTFGNVLLLISPTASYNILYADDMMFSSLVVFVNEFGNNRMINVGMANF